MPIAPPALRSHCRSHLSSHSRNERFPFHERVLASLRRLAPGKSPRPSNPEQKSQTALLRRPGALKQETTRRAATETPPIRVSGLVLLERVSAVRMSPRSLPERVSAAQREPSGSREMAQVKAHDERRPRRTEGYVAGSREECNAEMRHLSPILSRKSRAATTSPPYPSPSLATPDTTTTTPLLPYRPGSIRVDTDLSTNHRKDAPGPRRRSANDAPRDPEAHGDILCWPTPPLRPVLAGGEACSRAIHPRT